MATQHPQIMLTELLSRVTGRKVTARRGYAGSLLLDLGKFAEETRMNSAGREWTWTPGLFSLDIECDWQIECNGHGVISSKDDRAAAAAYCARLKGVKLRRIQMVPELQQTSAVFSNGDKLTIFHKLSSGQTAWYLIDREKQQVLLVHNNGELEFEALTAQKSGRSQ